MSLYDGLVSATSDSEVMSSQLQRHNFSERIPPLNSLLFHRISFIASTVAAPDDDLSDSDLLASLSPALLSLVAGVSILVVVVVSVILFLRRRDSQEKGNGHCYPSSRFPLGSFFPQTSPIIELMEKPRDSRDRARLGAFFV